MMDLWTLFVVNVFGGFWMATCGLSIVIFLILAMGGLSAKSTTMYLITFLTAMLLGYNRGIAIFAVVFLLFLNFGVPIYKKFSGY